MRHLRFVGPVYRYLLILLALFIIACGGTAAPAEDTATSAPSAAQPTAAATAPSASMTEPTSTPQAQPAATAEPETVGKSGGVVPMQKHAAPRRIDPHPSGSGIDMSEATLLYNGLVKYNDIGDVKEIIGDLATHWDVSDDGLTYTFFIPEGVQWTDGTPLTSEDVVFSLDRMVLEGESRPRAGALRTYYTSSEAIDPQSIAVNLKFPAAAFLPALGIDYMKVVPKHVVEAGTEIGDVAPQVGSGPYEMVDYRKGDSIEYKRNENYFKDGLPLLDGIIKYVITDKGRTKAGFETKQLLMATVGFTGMNVQDYLSLQESAGRPSDRSLHERLSGHRADAQYHHPALRRSQGEEGAVPGGGPPGAGRRLRIRQRVDPRTAPVLALVRNARGGTAGGARLPPDCRRKERSTGYRNGEATAGRSRLPRRV